MKDETAINSYELTLTPNYVSDWNFNDALRELIQNGTDQEVRIQITNSRSTTAQRKKCSGSRTGSLFLK